MAAPTIEAALDARFLSGAKDERVAASDFFEKKGLHPPTAAKVKLPLMLKIFQVIPDMVSHAFRAMSLRSACLWRCVSEKQFTRHSASLLAESIFTMKGVWLVYECGFAAFV